MANTAILFDFDGTLFFGTTEINYYALNKALDDMGLPRVDRAAANSTIGDKLPQVCSRLLGEKQAHRANELLAGLKAYAPEAISRYARLEPDCAAMLERLSGRAKLAICSNADPEYMDVMVDLLGIRHYFSHIWCSTPGYDKAGAIAEIKMILKADSVIMVGDRGEDVAAGKANNCVTVAIQNDFGARDALGADYDVYDHAQMERALLSILDKRPEQSSREAD